MRRELELVGERLEPGGSPPVAVRERLREQPVREPRVARQQRPVQVRADARPTRQPSKPVSPSLPKPATTRPSGSRPGRGASGRRGSRSRRASALARLELAVEQHVADHPPLAGDRVEREEPDARQLLAVEAAVAAAEQLVAAADREQRRAARDRLAQRAPPSPRDPPRRAPARGPGRRRRRRGRARRGRAGRPCRARVTSSSWPRHAARRASTAMLPRSA